jgi:hypothetical protein
MVDTHGREIAELLADKTDADFSVVLTILVKLTKELKRKK